MEAATTCQPIKLAGLLFIAIPRSGPLPAVQPLPLGSFSTAPGGLQPDSQLDYHRRQTVADALVQLSIR